MSKTIGWVLGILALSGVFAGGWLWQRPPEPPALPPAPVEAAPRALPALAAMPAAPQKPAALPLPPSREEPTAVAAPPLDAGAEKARQEVLTLMRNLGASLGKVMARQKGSREGEERKGGVEDMLVAADLMNGLARLCGMSERLQGDLGVDACLEGLDALLPEEARLTAEQKDRFRRTYLDEEKRLDAFGIPRHKLLLGGLADDMSGAMGAAQGAKDPGALNELQERQLDEGRDRIGQSFIENLNPGQRSFLEKNSQGQGGTFRIGFGN